MGRYGNGCVKSSGAKTSAERLRQNEMARRLPMQHHMRSTLALILGGGARAAGLFPLTQFRSKPAVPIGGKYRLIDVPISNCLHADLRRIYVLTQFNSASLNRHVSSTYRMDLFSQRLRRHSRGRADARQHGVVRGHGRRRAQGAPAFRSARGGLLPDPRRRSSLPDELREAPRGARRAARRHHHRGAAVDARRTRRAWASSRSTARGRSPASRKNPDAAAAGADEDQRARRFGRA